MELTLGNDIDGEEERYGIDGSDTVAM